MGEMIKASLVGGTFAELFELGPDTVSAPELKDLEVRLEGQPSKMLSVLRKPSHRRLVVGIDVGEKEWDVSIDEATIRLISSQLEGRSEVNTLTFWLTNEKGVDHEIEIDRDTTQIFIDLLDEK